MSIARTLSDYLSRSHIDYNLRHHQYACSSMRTAEMAHVPGGALAKAVVLREGSRYLMAVLPADTHVEIAALRRALHREVHLAAQSELQTLFPDCDPGAIPPVGEAYGLPMIWDASSSLGETDTVYFEAGDHENVVQVSGEQFHQLMASAERSHFSRPLKH